MTLEVDLFVRVSLMILITVGVIGLPFAVIYEFSLKRYLKRKNIAKKITKDSIFVGEIGIPYMCSGKLYFSRIKKTLYLIPFEDEWGGVINIFKEWKIDIDNKNENIKQNYGEELIEKDCIESIVTNIINLKISKIYHKEILDAFLEYYYSIKLEQKAKKQIKKCLKGDLTNYYKHKIKEIKGVLKDDF